MKFNVEKFKKLARPMTEAERQEIRFRDENRDWLSLSASFALSVRHILRTEGLTQKELAARMDVSPAQVTKILSGKENLSLQTIAKVEKALGKNIIRISESSNEAVANSDTLIFSDIQPYDISIPSVDYACDSFESSYPSIQ